jgi:hypothetical protein
MKKRILILFVPLFVQLPFGYAQNYSIKNRWNAKLSISYNRTNFYNHPFMHWDNVPYHPIQAKMNFRAECNYGILNWLEVGGYFGGMQHFDEDISSDKMYVFAPTFGVNANVHLLPFWVKNKKCRWELYLTAKYGGAYLINHHEFIVSGVSVSSGSSGVDEYSELHCLPHRYRDIFGAGIGGGVYFWNLFGLYAEVMGGQYAYFPEICKSYYTVRVGVEFKFTPKKKKEKDATVVEEEEEE